MLGVLVPISRLAPRRNWRGCVVSADSHRAVARDEFAARLPATEQRFFVLRRFFHLTSLRRPHVVPTPGNTGGFVEDLVLDVYRFFLPLPAGRLRPSNGRLNSRFRRDQARSKDQDSSPWST